MMPTYEGLRLKVLKYDRKLFGNVHQKRLKNKSFTIISNNCWGGEVYEYYNLQKQSPTVGCFFMADDYLKFITRLHDYLKSELTFIEPEISKWRAWPQVCKDKRFGHYPIGKIQLDDEDIEIFFLHYRSEMEARDKWLRRCQRVRYDKLLVKFNDQNGCQEQHIESFIRLPFEHKVFFTVRKWPNISKYDKMLGMKSCHFRQPGNKDSILASYEPFGCKKNIDVTEVINSL